MAASPEELIAEIERAFTHVTYPGDDDLTASTYGEEPSALVKDFSGKTDWRKLDPRFLDQAPGGWSSALSFFSDNALRFYLPAYLIADVRGQLSSADPASRLCSGLTAQSRSKRIAVAWGGGTLGSRAETTFAQFDGAQVAAIVAYLLWKLESEPECYNPSVEQALEDYWLPRAEQGSGRSG